MYGVSGIPLKTLLYTTRCDIETIHDSHDTLFGGKMPAPSASGTTTAMAAAWEFTSLEVKKAIMA